MKSRHTDKPQVEWMVGDVWNMAEIDSKSVTVVFDKGTLDAMIYGSPWSPPEEVLENSGRYINEIRLVKAEESKTDANRDKIMRVLEDDGVFLYVTYRQPHFIKPILN
jgi:hypothetical protein